MVPLWLERHLFASASSGTDDAINLTRTQCVCALPPRILSDQLEHLRFWYG